MKVVDPPALKIKNVDPKTINLKSEWKFSIQKTFI